jgi:hypothetical protein
MALLMRLGSLARNGNVPGTWTALREPRLAVLAMGVVALMVRRRGS